MINLEDYSIHMKAFTIKSLQKEGSELHWWCKIEPLSGDYEEEIYTAIFADDFRILFEVLTDIDRLRILPHANLREWWEEASSEDKESTLKEILYGFLRYKEEL